MELFRILYWGLSYTTGIICLTGLALRYFHDREVSTLKLMLFLLPFGLSIVGLSMMEALAGHPALLSISGNMALVGASLVVVTLPDYALNFDPIKYRQKWNRAFRFSGWLLVLLNLAIFFLPDFPGNYLPQLLTMLALGLAVFVAMGWINRASSAWTHEAPHGLMIVLFVLFGLAFVLDLLRSFIPALGFLGKYFFFFPGFYAFLNVFLLYSHVKLWAQELRDKAATPSLRAALDASIDLKRYGISEREADVLALLARGHTYLEMADSLCLSLATIKTHVSHLYEKTCTRNKVELLNLLSPRIGHSVDSAP
jgi:DNA-binding CsgD family transcriptional regulator